MWILPKQLHTSAFVQDTEALISDLKEQSQVCAQSLLVRSKPSPLPIWLRKWKRDSWTLHLSGRILRPSHGPAFVDRWISSVAVTLASHSVQPVSDLEQKIQDTSGHSSLTASEPCNLEFAFSRTSRDTSALDSEQSCLSWKQSVTEQRGEYSQRVKLAHHTNGNESSYWPTANSRDWKDSAGMSQTGTNPDGSQRNRTDQLARVVFSLGRPAPANPSTNGSRPASGGNPDGSANRLDDAKLYVTCDNRTDELRLLGNGVVPATAELAFRILSERLNT
jgi:hypothetical protein